VTEVLVPDSDLSVGGWTDHTGGSSNLYQAIDEASLNTGDYIQSPMNPTHSIYHFSFSDASALLTSGTFRVYFKKAFGNATIVNLRVQLFQSTTLIGEWDINDIPATDDSELITLTGAQLLAITDPTQIRGKIIANPLPSWNYPDSSKLIDWWDPADVSTLFKDTAATDPVTANGDIVKAMKGKKNNILLINPDSATAPRYATDAFGPGKPGLDFGNVQYFLRLNDHTLTNTTKLAAAAVFTLSEGSGDWLNLTSWGGLHPSVVVGGINFFQRYYGGDFVIGVGYPNKELGADAAMAIGARTRGISVVDGTNHRIAINDSVFGTPVALDVTNLPFISGTGAHFG
jgi:hypothetical protein